MPSKSKRNRRSASNRRELVNTADTNTTPAVPVYHNQTPISASTVTNKPKENTASSAGSVYFSNDLKWTGAVTGIIIILLILSYILFR